MNSKYILWSIEWINMKYGSPLVPKGWRLNCYTAYYHFLCGEEHKKAAIKHYSLVEHLT